jgi:hypothetical protein
LQTERKFKVIKSKLTVVVGAFALDRSIMSKMRFHPLDQDSSIDDLI